MTRNCLDSATEDDVDTRQDVAGGSTKHESPGRSTKEVFEDHLRCRSKGDLEGDIERNYHPDLVLMHVNGVERGHAGIRKSGHRLQQQLPNMRYEVRAKHVHGDYAYLEWRATSSRNRVSDGADSFVIEEGKIIFQSIHYSLEPVEGAEG